MSRVIVQDSVGRFKQSCEVTPETTLKQLRGMIKIPSTYEGFTFLNIIDEESISVNPASEQKALVKDYIVGEKRILTIKFTIKQKELSKQETTAKNKDTIDKSMKTKKLVEGWIQELDNFEKKSYNDAKEKQKHAEEKLNKMKDQLANQNILFSFQSSVNVRNIIDELKNFADKNEKYIKELKESKSLSHHELARKFSNSICVGFYKEKLRQIQILDIEKSEIFVDDEHNILQKEQFSYESQVYEKEHVSKIEKKSIGGSLSMMGGSPYFFLKGSASYNSAWQQKDQHSTNKKYNTYIKTMKAFNIGIGIKFTTDSIQITDDFHQYFKRIYDIYILEERGRETPSQKFVKKANEFFMKYGRQIQTGTYYLGNTYYNKVLCTFTKQQELQNVQRITSSALNVSVAGGGIFSGGFFAAKGSMHSSNETGFNKLIEKLNTQMSAFSTHKSYPNIQNVQTWGEVIQTTNSFWKILAKKVEKVSIFQILKNHKNLSKLNLRETDVEGFEECLLRCYKQFPSEYDDVIQLDIENFSNIAKEISRLTNAQKQFRALHICRLSQTCTNARIKSQLYLDEGRNQTLIKGKMKFMQPYKSLYLVRKVETIQTVISVVKQSKSSTIQSYFFFYSRMQENINLAYKIYLFRWQDCLLTQNCKNAINKEALQAVSQNFGKLEELIILADIPVINSLAMREFARSLRKRPNLKLQVVVDSKYKDEETNPNWTHETVKKGEVIYQ